MKKVIIIGASSGIGEALCRVFSEKKYEVGMAARRIELLQNIKNKLPGKAIIKQIDVTRPDEAMVRFKELLEEMGDVDIIILNAGAGHQNQDLSWPIEKLSIDVNITGFTAMINVAFHYFWKKGKGHLVGMSSIAGLRANRFAPAYGSSKSYMSQYLKGLRHKVIKEKINISITDIRPGFVDTAMAQGDKVFWSAPPLKAAQQMFKAIIKKKKTVYITKRWNLIAWLMKILPDFIYNRI